MCFLGFRGSREMLPYKKKCLLNIYINFRIYIYIYIYILNNPTNNSDMKTESLIAKPRKFANSNW